jgi:hypothetical protein
MEKIKPILTMDDPHFRSLVRYCKWKLKKYPDNYITGNKEPYISALAEARRQLNGKRD